MKISFAEKKKSGQVFNCVNGGGPSPLYLCLKTLARRYLNEQSVISKCVNYNAINYLK